MPLCPAQTSGPLNHPLRSSSESICVGQLPSTVCVREWGLCQHCPRAVSVAPPSSFTRWPTRWTNTNGITASLFHCSQHTSPYTERGRERKRGVTVPATDRTERVNGTLYNMDIFQFADLMIHRCVIFFLTVSTGTGSSRQLIPNRMLYWFLRCRRSVLFFQISSVFFTFWHLQQQVLFFLLSIKTLSQHWLRPAHVFYDVFYQLCH